MNSPEHPQNGLENALLFTDELQDSDELTEKYVHESFAKGEAIWLRRDQSPSDARSIDRLAEKIRESAKEKGEDEPLAQTYATLKVQIARWTVTVPKKFNTVDDTGKRVPHPQAGEEAPLTLEWIARIPGPVLNGLSTKMRSLYMPRSEAEEGNSGSPSDSSSTRSGTADTTSETLSPTTA